MWQANSGERLKATSGRYEFPSGCRIDVGKMGTSYYLSTAGDLFQTYPISTGRYRPSPKGNVNTGRQHVPITPSYRRWKQLLSEAVWCLLFGGLDHRLSFAFVLETECVILMKNIMFVAITTFVNLSCILGFGIWSILRPQFRTPSGWKAA
jgi:hypothetical protein